MKLLTVSVDIALLSRGSAATRVSSHYKTLTLGERIRPMNDIILNAIVNNVGANAGAGR